VCAARHTRLPSALGYTIDKEERSRLRESLPSHLAVVVVCSLAMDRPDEYSIAELQEFDIINKNSPVSALERNAGYIYEKLSDLAMIGYAMGTFLLHPKLKFRKWNDRDYVEEEAMEIVKSMNIDGILKNTSDAPVPIAVKRAWLDEVAMNLDELPQRTGGKFPYPNMIWSGTGSTALEQGKVDAFGGQHRQGAVVIHEASNNSDIATFEKAKPNASEEQAANAKKALEANLELQDWPFLLYDLGERSV
jgi:hypothetical protein